MFKRMSGGVALLVLCGGMVGVAVANNTPVTLGEGATTFLEQRNKVESELADGTTYVEISAQDRDKVRHALDRIQRHLDQSGSLDALRDEARVAVFNDQEVVNTILTQAREDSRVICRRESGTGTRLRKNDCATVAERRRAREAMQDGWHSIQRGGNIDPAQ
ncbi:MAG: hypothetical protein NVV60_07130 [Luteimonas sp.]|nr:hypothetical protein [Luteimonas sp.]